ncbi:MAG TPA: hypothetical protein VN181_12350 [Thermoanaerobaculia bacterium]|nr:hypothetical protein [Thermoanaerobaculia bacterium]
MQRTAGQERREFQRLELSPPIPGTLGTTAISVLEVGVLGARVHHAEPFDLTHADLRFSFEGEEIGMKCEIVRTIPNRSKYPESGLESGLRFIAALGDSGDRLRAMLGKLVVKAFDDRKDATASGTIAARRVDGDKTVRGLDAQFLCYRFEHDAWQRRRVFLPEQPPVGFTVARSVDSDEMARLCEVYQASDEEGRRLIRLFAELSVSGALKIPPRA